MARCSECRGKFRPAIERVGTLAGLLFDEFGELFEPLVGEKPLDGLALRLDPETALALPGSAYAERSKRNCIASAAKCF